MEQKNTIKENEEEIKKPIPRKTLLIWESYERPFKKRDKKFFINLISTALVILIFLLIAGQFTIIITILSLLFATYALNSVEPRKTTYVLTNKGIELKDEIIPWNRIKDFFISTKFGFKVINLNLKEGTMSRRYLITKDLDTLKKAKDILIEYVEEYQTPKKNDLVTRGIEKIGLKYKQ